VPVKAKRKPRSASKAAIGEVATADV
jgi:hypothetical protein